MSKVAMNGNGATIKTKKELISDDDDIPLSKRVKNEPNISDDDLPLFNNRKRLSKASDKSSQPEKKKVKKEIKSPKNSLVDIKSPKKEKVKKEEEPVWEWWKEEKRAGGNKWQFLEHAGPMFAPDYEPLPSHVKFYYDGKHMKLKPETEEIATFYAKMYDHAYTTMDVFNKNFTRDWTAVMSKEEKSVIRDLSKCDFKPMQEFFKKQVEDRKALSKEEKEKIKVKNEEITSQYGYCMMDSYKQKIGNFKIEPPGLFRGRGNHPKMGSVKRRVVPEDVIINCSNGSKVPKPPHGHKWKEVRHDPTVTWLACWQENVQNNFKYVMLNASSRLKGEKDWKKYETARKLHGIVDKIRKDYINDFSHREMRIRQRAVALYFIDRLALRAGNEKGEDEADTVGCCSLRVEHISLESDPNTDEYIVKFDFLGKDSIRYQNEVAVPKKVYKNLVRFKEGKQDGDDLFDRLNTTTLNQYLRDLMPGLTAKVFRTYNASITLERELVNKTNLGESLSNKVLSYNGANREVAKLCNHQRAVPKTFEKSMENLGEKIDKRKKEYSEVKDQAKKLKSEYSKTKDSGIKDKYEKLKKKLEKTKEMLNKLINQQTDREKNKDVALGTSKLNYLDPRISIAWCLKNKVPLNKIYNKTQLQKFQWAVDMTTEDYKFQDLDSDKSTNVLKACDSNDEDDEDDENDDE